VASQRDVKGLDARQRLGEISGLTGVDDPYEEPLAPDLVIATRAPVEESVALLLDFLTTRGVAGSPRPTHPSSGRPRVSPLLPVPRLVDGTVAVRPPGHGAGNWAGAPSAVLVDGVIHLAYRVRAPLGQGRGLAVVVARSVDGVAVEVGRPWSARERGVPDRRAVGRDSFAISRDDGHRASDHLIEGANQPSRWLASNTQS